LFDDPYVDPEAAERIAGNAEFRAAGEQAQRRSIVLLKNGATLAGKTLPLQGRPKLYLENVAPEVAAGYGQVVQNVEEADVAILRLKTPFEQRDGNFLERMFHAGDLDFKGEEKAHILDILARVPTIVDIYLDRPAVIPEIAERSAALLADFGASDTAVLDVIFGRFPPSGKLPFELPSSMEAVRRQKEDLPHDSENPLFPFGHGLTY
jgi:beta-glucosidase